jgi:hypothetical protein
MNSGSTRTKGVFLYDDPTIEKLKACTFFWKNVVVFESYLSDVVQYPDLVDVTFTLFKNDILKICHTPNGLRSALKDKIYSGLDRDLGEYIYHNAEKVTVEPKLPEDAERIIRESTERDYKDANLQLLIDKIIRSGIENKWLDTIREYDRVPFDSIPEDIKEGVMSEIRKIVEIEYKHYEGRDPKFRYSLEWRNRYFLEQTSVSSALFVRSAWLPYYQYKFGNYAVKDARRYLQGLNTVMPFVKRNSIDSISLNEILEIRRNRRWDNAMDRLAELCSEIRYGTDIGQFKKEMQEKVISEYQDALGEEEATLKDLTKQLLKGSIFTGISLIPIVGNVISAVTGLVDPLISYLWKETAQRNLPFFLNDLREMHTLK